MYSDGQVEKVLIAIGLGIESEAGDDYLVFCPYHNNYRTPAGEVSKERGTFYCFSCGTTTTLERLVMRVSGRNWFEATRLIKSKAIKTDIIADVTKSLSKQPEFVKFDESLVKRLHFDCMESSRAMNYLDMRSITADSIAKFSLGYSKNNDMVIVPVHSPDGMLVGFVARSIEGKVFKNSTGLPKSKVLFNLHRVKSSPHVVVVESSFDAIRMSQAGIPAVATLGAGLSKTQASLLKQYFTHVFTVPDADAAGVVMTERMVKYIGSMVTTMNLPPGAHDVGDLSDDQIIRLKKTIDDPLVTIV